MSFFYFASIEYDYNIIFIRISNEKTWSEVYANSNM